MNQDNGIGVEEAKAFLQDYYAQDLSKVELIGEGAWSRCFGFSHDGKNLAIRFGNYLNDFQTDQIASRYAAPHLPIPQVYDIGKAYEGYYAISDRVYGIPLESVSASQWQALLPSLVDALEAMRMTDISSTTGFGGWDEGETGSFPSWSAHLLSVNHDGPELRTQGWRERLTAHHEFDALFIQGYALLEKVVQDDIPRSLLHCDLINRNVLVVDDQLAGIFDWGCSRYGDHLYELAWFEFWGSWYPELNMDLLRRELEMRWQKSGYKPNQKEERLLACYLHIGLDHFAYNAYLGDWDALSATANRMQELAKL